MLFNLGRVSLIPGVFFRKTASFDSGAMHYKEWDSMILTAQLNINNAEVGSVLTFFASYDATFPKFKTATTHGTIELGVMFRSPACKLKQALKSKEEKHAIKCDPDEEEQTDEEPIDCTIEVKKKEIDDEAIECPTFFGRVWNGFGDFMKIFNKKGKKGNTPNDREENERIIKRGKTIDK